MTMDRHELSRAIRTAYSDGMKAHYTTERAISACVMIVRQHRPETDEMEARKLTARMIAEEPLG